MRDGLRRTATFVSREVVSSLRQPRLLAGLVLGPFLVLLVFGLGYSRDFPTLRTVVVGAEDDQLTQRIDDFVANAEVTGIAYVGTLADRDTAMTELRGGRVDLVVVLPAQGRVETNERAVIEIIQRTPDPVLYAQIEAAAQAAVHQVNDQVVAEVLAAVQEETSGLDDDLEAAREQLAALRTAVDTGDVATARGTATQIADTLEQLADRVAQAGGLVARLGLTGDPAALEDSLRTAADQLRTLSQSDPLQQLDEVAENLDRGQEALDQLQRADPEVLVRPFRADVVSDTPVRVTLDRFYAPGLLALMLQHVAITFVALGLVRERREGTADMLRVAPVSTGQRVAGTSLAHLLLGGAVAAGLTVLVMLVFGVPPPASWAAFVGLVALTLLASIGYGFLVGAAARSDSQAVQLSMLMLLVAIFFSGLFLPLERINPPVRWLSWALPTTHAFQGLQDLMLLGRQVPRFTWIGLSLMAIVSLGLARVAVPRRDARP